MWHSTTREIRLFVSLNSGWDSSVRFVCSILIHRTGHNVRRTLALLITPFFELISSYIESTEPKYMFNPIGSKATVCAFTRQPNIIITGHESGKVALFNVKTGDEVDNNERAHGDVVTDLQMSKDRTYCVTSSKDKAARVSSTGCCRFTLFTQI